MMPPLIDNAQLTQQDVPSIDASWEAISTFALTFNGYKQYEGELGSFANSTLRRFEDTKCLPETLIELRTCLFFEQRRWQHYGDMPDDEAMVYFHALVNAIRQLVK